jgi:hypothetical protein
MRNPFNIILVTVCLCNLTSCSKSKPINQLNNASGKVWLVKDISVANSSICTFIYNNQGQISSVNLGPQTSFNYSYQVKYSSLGKIDSLILFQGIYQIDPMKIVYEGTNTFVAQVIPFDTAHLGLGLYSWDEKGENELDEVIKQGTWISGSPYGPSVSYNDYLYDAGGGIHANSFHYIGESTQNLWALSSAGTGTAINNPFHKDRTNEQNFVYYFTLRSFFQDILLMSNALPNSIYEGYRDSSGVQLTVNNFYYKYSLDSNKNVNNIKSYYAIDRPGFSNFVVSNNWDITYEQH